MSQNYIATKWIDNRTVGTASIMNNMEKGIENAHNRIDGVDSQIKDIENITPEMYGAIGDGITDDTQAFIKAIETNRKIELNSSKTYLIKDVLNIKSNTVINGNNATIKWYNEDKILNDMSERAHWTGVFNIQGSETDTKSAITGYSTKREPLQCGCFSVDSVVGFNINDYIKIHINGGYNVENTYEDYKPSILTIAKIIDIDITSNKIYTDLYIPFDMSTTKFGDDTIITKVKTVDNVLIENIIIIDTLPWKNHSNTDGMNKDKLACGISTNLASNIIIRNIKGKNMKNPLIMFHYCHNYTCENIENIDPSYTGPAEGYCVKSNRSTVGNISKIYGKGCRHLVDLSWSSFTTVDKCNDNMPYDKNFAYSLDLHGVCEHNITFRDCKGSFVFGNGIGSFPNLSSIVTIDNCKGDLLLGNVENLKISMSDIILRSYSPDSARIISVDISDSKIEIGRSFNAIGSKRGIDLDTRLTINNCNILPYKGFESVVFTQNTFKNIDLVAIEDSFIDFSDSCQSLRIEEALTIEFNNNYVTGCGIDFLRESTTDIKNINYECDNNVFYVKENDKFVEGANRNLIKLKNIKYSSGLISVSNNKINANGSPQYPLNLIDIRDSDGYFDNSNLTICFSNNTIMNNSNTSNISVSLNSDRIKFISNNNSVKSDLLYYDQLLKYSCLMFVDGKPVFNSLNIKDKLNINDNLQITTNNEMISLRKIVNGAYDKELLTLYLNTDVAQFNVDTFRLKNVTTLPTPRKGGMVYDGINNKYLKCTDGTNWVEF